MDCGSIRSSVVDWVRLQQSAADFNRAWALNAPPQLVSNLPVREDLSPLNVGKSRRVTMSFRQ